MLIVLVEPTPQPDREAVLHLPNPIQHAPPQYGGMSSCRLNAGSGSTNGSMRSGTAASRTAGSARASSETDTDSPAAVGQRADAGDPALGEQRPAAIERLPLRVAPVPAVDRHVPPGGLDRLRHPRWDRAAPVQRNPGWPTPSTWPAAGQRPAAPHRMGPGRRVQTCGLLGVACPFIVELPRSAALVACLEGGLVCRRGRRGGDVVGLRPPI